MKNLLARIALLVGLVILECCLFGAAFRGSRLDKPASQALYEWRKNPTPETEAAWQAQEQRVARGRRIAETTAWSLMVVAGIGIYYVVRGPRRES